MTEPRTPEKTDQRLEARAETPQDKLPTYQELLDDASDASFPASDPPATHAATHTAQPVSTGMDARDWKLQPDGDTTTPQQTARHVVAAFDDEEAARNAQAQALQQDLPTARLDLPADQDEDAPAATVTVVACDDQQVQQAVEIVRGSGASQVELRRGA